MEFYSTAALVIPTLLIVAALQSELFRYAADRYKAGGAQKLFGRFLMFSIGGSLICLSITLIVLALNKDWLTSLGWLRIVVLVGCILAVVVAWAGGHLEWIKRRNAA